VSEAKDVDIKILAPTKVVIDKEKGISIMQGPPTQLDQQGVYNTPGTEMLVIPNSPHVFKVDELTVRDSNHPNEQLSDVNVLMAHGIKVGNHWRFIDGGDVVETVNAYNTYAGQSGLKPIEFLVVCNEAPPHPMGIRVGMFDSSQNIAYSVGENVHIFWGGLSKVEAGRTKMDISVDKSFFGLDQLIQHKQLQGRIKIIS
jgi:hypothetical protein